MLTLFFVSVPQTKRFLFAVLLNLTYILQYNFQLTICFVLICYLSDVLYQEQITYFFVTGVLFFHIRYCILVTFEPLTQHGNHLSPLCFSYWNNLLVFSSVISSICSKFGVGQFCWSSDDMDPIFR